MHHCANAEQSCERHAIHHSSTYRDDPCQPPLSTCASCALCATIVAHEESSRSWEHKERARRLEAFKPSTAGQLMERLPSELVLEVVARLDRCWRRVPWRPHDRLAAYQGLVGLSRASKALNKLVAVPRVALINFRFPGLGNYVDEVPLRREGTSLVYRHEPNAFTFKIPVTMMDDIFPNAILQRVCVFAPELLQAYVRMAARDSVADDRFDFLRLASGVNALSLTPRAESFRFCGRTSTNSTLSVLPGGTIRLNLVEELSAPDYRLCLQASRVPNDRRDRSVKWFYITRLVVSCAPR